jgi:hypothetical protein
MALPPVKSGDARTPPGIPQGHRGARSCEAITSLPASRLSLGEPTFWWCTRRQIGGTVGGSAVFGKWQLSVLGHQSSQTSWLLLAAG